MSEREALLNISARIDAGTIKDAQTQARKVVRDAAKAQRQQINQAKKEFEKSVNVHRRQVKDLRRQLTADTKAAILESDARIAAQFQTRRVNQVNDGMLGIAIAQHDGNKMP